MQLIPSASDVAGGLRRPPVVVDVLGLVLAAMLALWATGVAASVGGDPQPLRDLLVLAIAAYAVGRIATELDRRLVPASITAAAAVVAVLRADTLTASPFGSPLGYANSTAAFYSLAAAAGAVWALRERDPRRAAVAWVLSGLLALVPWLNGSVAGAASTLLVLGGAAVAVVGSSRARRLTIVVAGTAVAAGFAATVAMALSCDDEACALPGRLIGLLSRNRPALWSDAIELWQANPRQGVGPDRFALVSSVTGGDPDLFHAHNALLEVGAELGTLGLLLAAGLMAWVFVRLLVSPLGGGVAIVATALCGLLLQAHIDYVLHTPALAVTAVLLLASVSGSAPAPPDAGTPVRQRGW